MKPFFLLAISLLLVLRSTDVTCKFIEVTAITEAVAGWVTRRIIPRCVGSYPSVSARFARCFIEGLISPSSKENPLWQIHEWANYHPYLVKNAAALS
jgi:hypothetical protein